jgi:hypothetical protein
VNPEIREELVDVYVIGSEGGSAWAWIGPSPDRMIMVGYTAPTRTEAIDKVINEIQRCEAKGCLIYNP